MSDHQDTMDRIAEEWDAYERWLERPILQRLNAEIVDAGCAAANAIVSTLFTITFVQDDDSEF